MTYILNVFLFFFIYSVLGYILEVTVTSIADKRLNFSRGFLIGPYIPIYGTGAILMSYLLHNYQNNIVILFILSTFICTAVEYLTSYVMEKMYKLRWWDYSHIKFNLNGRVCLTNSLLFGVGGVLIMKFINPIITKLFILTPNTFLLITGLFTFLIFTIDLIISIVITFKLEININKYINTDATLAIKNEVSRLLARHKFSVSRILTAYPDLKSINNKELKFVKDIMNNIKKETEKIKKEIKKIKEEYKDNKEERKQKIKEIKDSLIDKIIKDK